MSEYPECISKIKLLCISSRAFKINGETVKAESKQAEANYLTSQLGFLHAFLFDKEKALQNKPNSYPEFPNALNFFSELCDYFNEGCACYYNEEIPFNDQDMSHWNKVINKLATEAARTCGCLHDVYVNTFSQHIDREISSLPVSTQLLVKQLAISQDYAGEDERMEMQKFNSENGLCSHGIEPDCCPAGCSEIY